MRSLNLKALSFQAIDFLAFLFVLLFVLASISSGAETANFICDNEKICKRAEQLRDERSIYWTGQKLPGDWFQKCPITWEVGDKPAGGTSFNLANGEVNNFSMVVAGSLNDVINDVLPHEVDHAVRYSLIRRPIARLFDEGSSGLAESTQSQNTLREQTQELIGEPFPVSYIDLKKYPPDGRELFRLYNGGHSICDFLVDRSGPKTLFKFQADPRLPSEKLQDFYQLTPGGLVQEWKAWYQGVEFDYRNIVYVESEDWCKPCKQFKRDKDAGLFPGYQFKIVKPRPGIKIPLFSYRGKTYQGYHGPALLNTWLKSLDAISVVPQPFVRNQNTPVQTPVAQGQDKLSQLRQMIQDLRAEKDGLLRSVSEISKDVGEFKEAGIIGKVKNLYDLKGDVSDLKENASNFSSDIKTLRESMSQTNENGEKVPWYYGLWLGFAGILKRRYLNAGGIA